MYLWFLEEMLLDKKKLKISVFYNTILFLLFNIQITFQSKPGILI